MKRAIYLLFIFSIFSTNNVFSEKITKEEKQKEKARKELNQLTYYKLTKGMPELINYSELLGDRKFRIDQKDIVQLYFQQKSDSFENEITFINNNLIVNKLNLKPLIYNSFRLFYLPTEVYYDIPENLYSNGEKYKWIETDILDLKDYMIDSIYSSYNSKNEEVLIFELSKSDKTKQKFGAIKRMDFEDGLREFKLALSKFNGIKGRLENDKLNLFIAAELPKYPELHNDEYFRRQYVFSRQVSVISSLNKNINFEKNFKSFNVDYSSSIDFNPLINLDDIIKTPNGYLGLLMSNFYPQKLPFYTLKTDSILNFLNKSNKNNKKYTNNSSYNNEIDALIYNKNLSELKLMKESKYWDVRIPKDSLFLCWLSFRTLNTETYPFVFSLSEKDTFDFEREVIYKPQPHSQMHKEDTISKFSLLDYGKFEFNYPKEVLEKIEYFSSYFPELIRNWLINDLSAVSTTIYNQKQRNQKDANAEAVEKNKLYSKYGKKFVDEALNGNIVIGMHEDLVTSVIKQFWSIESYNETAAGLKIYCKSILNSAIRLSVTVSNKKVVQVKVY